jgi:hypothetical protein
VDRIELTFLERFPKFASKAREDPPVAARTGGGGDQLGGATPRPAVDRAAGGEVHGAAPRPGEGPPSDYEGFGAPPAEFGPSEDGGLGEPFRDGHDYGSPEEAGGDGENWDESS